MHPAANRWVIARAHQAWHGFPPLPTQWSADEMEKICLPTLKCTTRIAVEERSPRRVPGFPKQVDIQSSGKTGAVPGSSSVRMLLAVPLCSALRGWFVPVHLRESCCGSPFFVPTCVGDAKRNCAFFCVLAAQAGWSGSLGTSLSCVGVPPRSCGYKARGGYDFPSRSARWFLSLRRVTKQSRHTWMHIGPWFKPRINVIDRALRLRREEPSCCAVAVCVVGLAEWLLDPDSWRCIVRPS